MTAFRPTAPLARPPGALRAETTPFVGRDLELSLLGGLFERARSTPSVELVTIVAEPGLGKSRLVRELARHVDALPDLVTWRIGRCLPYGDGISLWALGEIVKSDAGILDTDDRATLAAKLEAVRLLLAAARRAAPPPRRAGPARRRTRRSSSVLEPPCAAYPETPFQIFAQEVQWSPDGTMIAAVDQVDMYVVVWDARDGHLVFKGPTYPDRGVKQVIFTPDSKHLVVSYAAKVNHPATGLVEMLSTESWTAVTKANLDPAVVGADGMGFPGFSPDGSTIFAVGGLQEFHSSLLWLDAVTLQVRDPKPVPAAQMIRAVALSPDGSTMATAGGDGVLRVWDTKTGEVNQEIDFGGPTLQGVGYIDRTHLAVGPQGGGLLIMTLDASELVKLVRASVTRTFTDTECKTYGIERCPTRAASGRELTAHTGRSSRGCDPRVREGSGSRPAFRTNDQRLVATASARAART